MACSDGGTFTVKGIGQPSIQGATISSMSQTGLDFYGPYILGALGGDCVVAKQYMIDNFLLPVGDPGYPFGPLANHVVKNGTAIPRPIPATLVPVPAMSSSNATYYFTAYINSAPIGDVGWLWDSVNDVPEPYDTLSWPAGGVIMGVNCDSFVLSATVGDPTNRLNWDVNVPQLTSFDFNAWWCCVNPSCCGAPPVGNAFAPSFLIPRPENPAPGEENASVPPLESLLLLSNYTFQFPDNFGVPNK